jgi:hypothetical protein
VSDSAVKHIGPLYIYFLATVVPHVFKLISLL